MKGNNEISIINNTKKEEEIINKKDYTIELSNKKRSFSEIEDVVTNIITESPRKKQKKTLGKLPTIEQLRNALKTVYSDMGPRLSESHYQGGLHVYLEKFFNLKIIKEYPLKFQLYGSHLGYKKHGYFNHVKTDDDGKFYNYLDLFIEGSNGNIIIECKINESYQLSFKPNLKSFLGKYKPSEKTFDQIQRYHVLLEKNNIEYKAIYLMNFPSKKRSKIQNHYVKQINKNKKNILYD